jgi:hypothetical protein
MYMFLLAQIGSYIVARGCGHTFIKPLHTCARSDRLQGRRGKRRGGPEEQEVVVVVVEEKSDDNICVCTGEEEGGEGEHLMSHVLVSCAHTLDSTQLLCMYTYVYKYMCICVYYGAFFIGASARHFFCIWYRALNRVLCNFRVYS